MRLSSFSCRTAMVAGLCLLSLTTAWGQSPAGAMLKLLQSGRVPEQRLPSIVKLVCERGNADDLAYIFSEVQKDNHWPDELRAQTLSAMAVAAAERKVVPSGDLSSLDKLMTSPQPAIQIAAVDLADDWHVTAAIPQLLAIANSPDATLELKKAALGSLVRLAPAESHDLLLKLARSEEPFALRLMAISVLARLNLGEAAELAAEFLKLARPEDDFTPVLVPFLDLNQGSRALAAQLQMHPPEKDVARLLLRQMYAMGRTDLELNQVLSSLAGMNQVVAPPTKEEVEALVKEAQEQGNPNRGELVFRRKDLSCMNCHAVSKAGGQIGPDLSAIGSSSPVEYLVTSVLDPDQAIKEAYISKTILTVDGKILQGIVADRTADALVLKDATGKKVSVPLEDIEEEVEGKSLMPKGLVNFMTHAELLDLVAFLSHLGKPGEFAIRSTQRMQRYRLLETAPASVLESVPTLPVFEAAVFKAKTWQSVYAKVNGELPLEEMAERSHSRILYVQGDLACTESGAAQIQLNSAEGVTIWMDLAELTASEKIPVELSSGEHAITLRIDLNQRTTPQLIMEIVRPGDSAAEFTVVDGQ